jgi:hypothetical protein
VARIGSGKSAKGTGTGGPARGYALQAAREAHVQRIADLMSRGNWEAGAANAGYAAQYGVAESTVHDYAGEAHRRNAIAMSDGDAIKTLAKSSILGIAAIAREEYARDRDPRQASVAVASYAKMIDAAHFSESVKNVKTASDAAVAAYSQRSREEKLRHLRALVNQATAAIAELEREVFMEPKV